MLPSSGAISLSNVNTEVGAAATTTRGLDWVRANTWYSYTDLNSLHGLYWFTPVSSQNSITRTPTATTTNCSSNVGSGNIVTTVSQCSYSHGTHLQAACNCNCAYKKYSNCNCNCACNCNCK